MANGTGQTAKLPLMSDPSDAIALVTLHASYSHSSLALADLLAFCQNEPFFDQIHRLEQGLREPREPLTEQVVALKPMLVGLSTYLWNINESLALAEAVKRALPATRIVLGGPEAGPRREQLIHHPAVDFVIEGEGEAAFRDLVRWLRGEDIEPATISGLAWFDGESPRFNPIALLPVDQIPTPIADGLYAPDKKLLYWETTRGCPFRCTFCTSAEDRARQLPAEKIQADLEVIRTMENKVIKLLDRSFHLGRDRTLELLQRFLDTPDSIRFHLELNPDRVSAEVLALFREAPPDKFQFEIGLQTLDAGTLATIDRHMDVEKAVTNIRELVALKRHHVHLDLIAGLPGESAEQFADALDRTFLLAAEHLQLGTLKLLPGTPLRRQAEQFGYEFDAEPPYEVSSNDALSAADFGRFKAHATLLERLWNSDLAKTSLYGISQRLFDGRISRLFDTLLDLHQQRIEGQPATLFQQLVCAVESIPINDPIVTQLLTWDYCGFDRLGHRTPRRIADNMGPTIRLDIDNKAVRLPVIYIEGETADIISAVQREEVVPGHYVRWPQKHLKGRPVRTVPVEPPAEEIQ